MSDELINNVAIVALAIAGNAKAEDAFLALLVTCGQADMDRERLDWIEASQSSIDPDCESDGSLLCGWDVYTPSGSEHLTTGRTLRDAIDAAREEKESD